MDRHREQHHWGGALLSLSAIGEVAESCGVAMHAGWQEERLTPLLVAVSPREEEVLLLWIQGLEYRQIAAALAISTNSVKTPLARGIRKMKQALRATPPARRLA